MWMFEAVLCVGSNSAARFNSFWSEENRLPSKHLEVNFCCTQNSPIAFCPFELTTCQTSLYRGDASCLGSGASWHVPAAWLSSRLVSLSLSVFPVLQTKDAAACRRWSPPALYCQISQICHLVPLLASSISDARLPSSVHKFSDFNLTPTLMCCLRTSSYFWATESLPSSCSVRFIIGIQKGRVWCSCTSFWSYKKIECGTRCINSQGCSLWQGQKYWLCEKNPI